MEENEVIKEQIDESYFDFDVLVSEKEPITVKVRVAKGIDPTNGKSKMIVYRPKLLQDNIDLLNTLIKDIQEKIDIAETTSEEYLTPAINNDKKDINILKARIFKLEVERTRYETILEQPFIEWTAKFKCPDLAARVAIDTRSMTENVYGDSTEFNDFENIRAKIELLLISWDVKNKGKLVPVKDAMKCDSDLLKAFSEEFDIQNNGYLFEEKKS